MSIGAMIEQPPPREQENGNDLMWWLGCTAVTALAAAVRFYDLGLKPLHHDEGVNGFFLTTLFREGVYKYDPANYHGPTLYYISLAFAKAFGLETIPVRASVAIFGILTVILALFLKRYIGRWGSLFAALLLALSPGLVYISRYFIHEIFFVFLSLAVVVCVIMFIEKEKAGPLAIAWMVLVLLVCFLPSTLNLAATLGGEFRGAFFVVEIVLVFFVMRMLLAWDGGRPIYLLLASASVILLFATKETAFITLGVMLIACVCVWVWGNMIRRFGWKTRTDELSGAGELSAARFWRNLSSSWDRLLLIAAAAFLFIYVGILFFSSFFTYPQGVNAAFEAYTLWTRTGTKDHTQNGFWAYLRWGMKLEAPIFILSALGIVIAFVKSRHRFALFTALWAFGLFAAYTLIPYKTPWLAVSFILPMCLIAGYGINELVTAKNISARPMAGVLAALATAVLAYQTYELNFVRYDDDTMPYVYAHTRREFLDLMNEIHRFAEKSGEGKSALIQIVSPDYWPMVWYLKDHPHANFHAKLVDADNAEMIIAKKSDQDQEVIRRYSANYVYEGTYPLRPGVDLVLLVRKDLADADSEPLYRIATK